MTVPEQIGQFPVGNLFRVEFDLNRLGMIPQFAVRGIFFCPPRVSHTGPLDSFDAPEPGIHSPESAESEGGGFHARGFSEYHGHRSPQHKQRQAGGTKERIFVFHTVLLFQVTRRLSQRNGIRVSRRRYAFDYGRALANISAAKVLASSRSPASGCPAALWASSAHARCSIFFIRASMIF